MSTELNVLALYALLTLVLILVQVLLAWGQVGLPYLASPRDEHRELTGSAGRALRASMNSAIAMALFAPAVLILQVKGLTTPQTLMAAQVFLWMRVIYVIVYLVGIPWVRTLVWTVAFLCTAWLYIAGM